MRKEKGFTLIELLAVIVILAIIALIATPIVLNIIKTSRKGAFARSAEGVLQASKIYYASSLMEEVTPKEQEFTCDNKTCVTESNIKLDVDGSMGEGNVKITSDGKISFELGNGTYCAEKEEDSDKITITEKKCGEIVINKPSDLKITYKTEKAGEITVVGSVSNKLAEIESFEFSIDNGTTWEKAESNTYTFTGLELGKEYKVLMRVTNKNKEVEQIELDSIMTSLMDAPKVELIPDDTKWSVSKALKINDEEIDKNIYKVVYSIDNGSNFIEYTTEVELTTNVDIIIDVQKRENNASILKSKHSMKIMKIDATIPNVSLEGLLDEIMVGDSYALPTSYTVNDTLSGGSVKCIDEEKNVIEDTKTLGIGEHTITCTVTTGAGNNAEASKTIKVTEQRYKTGEPYELGGYKWHVISDDGINLTLLMDANQLGDNSNMAHCTNDTSSSTDCGVDSTKKYYVYSWDKSKIRKYLNGEFLTSLESKIENEIVSTSICADPSRNDNSKTYGAYLKKELDFLGMSSKCSKYTEDKIRLASNSEVFYMSPYYSSNSSIYPNVDGIVRLDSNSDYESWFISSSNNYFWTLSASIDTKSVVSVEWTGSVNYPGTVADNHSFVSFAVRPVITIVK